MITIIETERAVLGSLILRNELIPQTAKSISETIFQEKNHKTIYSVIKSLYLSGVGVDLITLSNKIQELKIKIKKSEISDLISETPSSVNVKYYIEILKKEDTKRKLVELSQEIKKYGEENTELDQQQILALIQTKILNLSSNEKEDSLEDQIDKLFKVQNEYQSKPAGSLIGISTGYKKLDAVIDGFRKGHFWVLGGYTSAGKTFASLNLVAHLIRQKKRVVFYSLEMTEVDIISRLAGILTKQNTKVIIRGEQEIEIKEAIELIKESDFEIVTTAREISDIQFSMFEKEARNHVDLFVVDFIQLVHVKGSKSDYEKTTITAHKLQDLAKMLSTTILALSQISNESAKLQSEDVSGFKGSGDIEAAADLALKLKHGHESTKDYKQSLYNVNKEKGKIKLQELPKVMWGIHKNRHGESGTIDMRFNGYTGEFLTDPFDSF